MNFFEYVWLSFAIIVFINWLVTKNYNAEKANGNAYFLFLLIILAVGLTIGKLITFLF